jgi:hypothetical protein
VTIPIGVISNRGQGGGGLGGGSGSLRGESVSLWGEYNSFGKKWTTWTKSSLQQIISFAIYPYCN